MTTSKVLLPFEYTAHKCDHCGMRYVVFAVIDLSDDIEERYDALEQDASELHCPYCGREQGD